MNNYPYILFNKSPEQLRLLGARGGRAYGRNLRARRARLVTLAEAVPARAASEPATAESIVVLDALFPWLRGAERRLSRKPDSPPPIHETPYAGLSTPSPDLNLIPTESTPGQQVRRPNRPGSRQRGL